MTQAIRIAAFVVYVAMHGFAAMAQPTGAAAQQNPLNSAQNLTWDFFDPQPLLLLDSVRLSLGKNTEAADGAIYQHFSQQLDALVLNIQDAPLMARYLQKAAVYAHGQYFLPAERAILFDAMSNKMLGKLSDTLEMAINAKLVDPENEDIAYLIRRLADNNQGMNFEVNNRAKLWRYLKEGRLGYVFHKLTTTYKREFFGFLALLAAGLMLLWYARKRLGGPKKQSRAN